MKVTRNDNEIDAKVVGKLDRSTSPEFDRMMGEYLDDDVRKITLDLSETIYVSSAGLRVILALEKKMNNVEGKLIIRNVPELVFEVFSETGLSEILTIE